MRSEYRALIEDGAGDSEATRRILDSSGAALADPDDGPVVWLALAFTQSKIGRLEPEVAARALEIISSGEGMAGWEEQGQKMVARRRATLEKVRVQLVGPQPARRRLRPPWRHVTSLLPGDVLAYRTSSGAHLLLRVARIDDSREGAAPVMVLLDFAPAEIPAPAQIAGIPDCRVPARGAGGRPTGSIAAFVVYVDRKGDADFAEKDLAVVGNIGARPGDERVTGMPRGGWAGFGAKLARGIELQALPRPAGLS